MGRSAAGRALDASAVDLAVIAHIRHTHTNYDELLICGTERPDARARVREKIDRVPRWIGRAKEQSILAPVQMPIYLEADKAKPKKRCRAMKK